MSSAEQLQLLNSSTNSQGKIKNDALTAKRRQQRMRNLNITYTKSRKRRKSAVLKNVNSERKIAAANVLVKADESSCLLVETVVYRCPYCTFWHRTLNGFHDHMLENHEHGTQMYQCTYCHLNADTQDEILRHINEFSKTDSSHKRATCLLLSKNVVERYAAYLKTTQVPSSANFGQLSQNSVEVKQSGKNKSCVESQNLTNTSQETANSSTVQDEEDLLYFSDSPILTFPDISLSSPVSDGSVMDSPRAQFGTVLSTPDYSEKEDPLEPNSKKMRKDKMLNNNEIISKNPEINSDYSAISGSHRALRNPMEIGCKENLLHPANKENPSCSNEKMSQQQQQSKNKNSSSANVNLGYSESDDSDSDTCIPTSCSEYSDWLTDRGASLEPPKFMKTKLSKPRLQSRFGAIQKIFRPTLSSVVPRRLPFYPQMGDEVIYFRQGHELYLDTVRKKKLFKINPRSLPWYNQLIHEQELVKIISINYEIKPQIRLYCLKLGLMDPTTRSLTGETFSLKYHDVEGVLDFLVLQQDFDLAVQRTWQPGDRFRSLINDGYGVQMWWEGQIVERKPFNIQYPNSMFLCFKIRWDNNEMDYASPWDLEKIDCERRPPRPGASVPVLPNEIASLLYKPRAEDWPPVGDRDSECDRISSGFSKVMDMYVAKHFAAPVNLELYPTYASIVKYPMDLSTIKARLLNRFYRRVTSVQYDVRRIHINAFRFNLPKSDIVRNSSIISDLCLEIIRNRDSDDVKSMYREIVEKYRILDEKEEEKALELSRKANTQRGKSLDNNIKTKIQQTTPAAPNWRQQCKDLFEMINQSEDSASCRGPHILEMQSCSQAVDRQMDLQTVCEKLRLNSYLTPMDFANDVRYILNYSKNYHTEKGSPNFPMILRLSALFEEYYSKILATLKQPKNSARKSMNSSSKDAVSRKGKSLAPPSSTRDMSKSVENSKENEQIIPSCLSQGQSADIPNSSPQRTGHQQLCVPSQSVVPTVDRVINVDPEIPGATFADSNATIVLQGKAFLQDNAPLLNEKEQLNVDIENGFRKLSLIESELKKDMRLLSEQQKKIDDHNAKLFQRREAADRADSESESQIPKLTCLTELREKINRQLLLCTKEKLTQELAWREYQAIALKLELTLNSIDPIESALEFKTTEKMLTEKRHKEKQSEHSLNSIREEITSLEKERQNLDCEISDLKAMHDQLSEMKAIKTTIEAQILMKRSKKNDILCDLSKWISAWKAMEMKLIQILYQEALGDIEKMANERYNKLEQLVKCVQNLNGSSPNKLIS